MSGKRWSQEEQATARRMMDEGYTHKELAYAIDRSVIAVGQWIRRNDVNSSRYRMWSTSEFKRLAEMMDAGETTEAMCVALGRHAGSIMGGIQRIRKDRKMRGTAA